MTNGNTAPLYVLGGTQNDSFEVDHNVGMLYLAGDEGDDTFLINTFLVLKQNPDKPDLVTNLTTLFGGTGSNRYQYLQNAPVFINGGSGYDTLIIVGTPIDDTFIVTDTYIAGAGRLVNFTNIEAIEVDGAGGNDSIYVMSTNPDLTVTVNGGPGDDVIHIGGTPPPLVYAPPPFTYTPPAYTVTSLQVVMTTVTNNYTTYTFHEDLLTWAAIGGTGNPNAAATLLLDQAFGITPGGTTTATFSGLSVSYDWDIFDFFDLLPSVTVTLSGVQVSYQVPTIRIFQRQIQPPPVTITPAPVALMAPPSLDASQVKSRVIILGGNDFETNGDTVVYENENGAADVGQLVQRTTPRMVEVGEQTDGTPIFAQDTLGGVGLTDTYLSLESTGLGISPAGTMSVEKTPYFGIQMQGIEHVQLRLSNAAATFLIADNEDCTGVDTTHQTCVPDAGQLAAPTVAVYGGTGNDTFVIGGIGAATSVTGGGGIDSTTVEAPSGDLSGILGRLTVDGDDLLATQTTHVMPDNSDPEHVLVQQFLNTSILVIPTTQNGTGPDGQPYYQAAWVPILCVDTATATGTFCHDSSSSALVGSVEVRSAVIDGQGNLTTVDVQQKGSLVYAQQEYGYQDFETLTLPVYRFSLGLFGFYIDHITIDVPLFLNPDGSSTTDDTGVQKIVTAAFGTTSPASAVPLYLDDAGNETTSNTGIPVIVPDGTYSDGRPSHLEVYVDPSFKNVLAPWGTNLLSDGDFSQSVPSNGAANGWTSTNIDGNGGWFPDYFILNSNGSASTDPTISQSLTNVNPGVTYQITGYVTNVYPQYGGSSPNAFEIAVNGQVVLAKSKAQANGWTWFTTTWTDVNTTTATLSLIGEHGDDSSFAITDVAFQAQNTPAYVTDWANGTDLCIDGSGREVACPAGPTGGLRASIIPVYATQLTPFVRTADVSRRACRTAARRSPATTRSTSRRRTRPA